MQRARSADTLWLPEPVSLCYLCEIPVCVARRAPITCVARVCLATRQVYLPPSVSAPHHRLSMGYSNVT